MLKTLQRSKVARACRGRAARRRSATGWQIVANLKRGDYRAVCVPGGDAPPDLAGDALAALGIEATDDVRYAPLDAEER
jgi:hypothetical protein